MVSSKSGRYKLTPQGSCGGEAIEGEYTYEAESAVRGRVMVDKAPIGTLCYAPASETPLECFSWEGPLMPDRPMNCIGVTNSEIMKQIQLKSSQGSYFVLPSQLNGAEYPSNTAIVRRIQDYCTDNTGGPRGQLAVHPAAGQFVLDNAANRENERGINAVDKVLEQTRDLGFDLQNGYLKMPAGKVGGQAKECFTRFAEALHSVRPLIMHDVQASGLRPDKRSLSQETHTVGLVYASAVPVDAYNNSARTEEERKLHGKIAEAMLVAQYYGALRAVAMERRGATEKTTVYLLPLGGGVFNNPWPSIARAMAQAVELLAEDPAMFNAVEIEALAWEGSPSEKHHLESMLAEHKKLFRKEAGEKRYVSKEETSCVEMGHKEAGEDAPCCAMM